MSSKEVCTRVAICEEEIEDLICVFENEVPHKVAFNAICSTLFSKPLVFLEKDEEQPVKKQPRKRQRDEEKTKVEPESEDEFDDGDGFTGDVFNQHLEAKWKPFLQEAIRHKYLFNYTVWRLVRNLVTDADGNSRVEMYPIVVPRHLYQGDVVTYNTGEMALEMRFTGGKNSLLGGTAGGIDGIRSISVTDIESSAKVPLEGTNKADSPPPPLFVFTWDSRLPDPLTGHHYSVVASSLPASELKNRLMHSHVQAELQKGHPPILLEAEEEKFPVETSEVIAWRTAEGALGMPVHPQQPDKQVVPLRRTTFSDSATVAGVQLYHPPSMGKSTGRAFLKYDQQFVTNNFNRFVPHYQTTPEDAYYVVPKGYVVSKHSAPMPTNDGRFLASHLEEYMQSILLLYQVPPSLFMQSKRGAGAIQMDQFEDREYQQTLNGLKNQLMRLLLDVYSQLPKEIRKPGQFRLLCAPRTNLTSVYTMAQQDIISIPKMKKLALEVAGFDLTEYAFDGHNRFPNAPFGQGVDSVERMMDAKYGALRADTVGEYAQAKRLQTAANVDNYLKDAERQKLLSEAAKNTAVAANPESTNNKN